jgi:hypothetical protein
MGNHFRYIILAPAVSASAVEAMARLLRSEQLAPVTLTLCDLVQKRVRKPEFQAAKHAEVRLIEIETTLHHPVLIDAAERSFGPLFLYREQNDEGLDVCHPNASWLKATFARVDLDWLLELPEQPPPWNRTSYYALPGNPPTSSVLIGVQASLLRWSLPNESRRCPMCGTSYTTRHSRGQCTNQECSFVWEPFETSELAYTIRPLKLDAFAWGTCPRCRRSRCFTNKIEQCHRCGQLMIEDGSSHPLALIDNVSDVHTFLEQIRRTGLA